MLSRRQGSPQTQLPLIHATQASAALASLLACFAGLKWAPPREWLAVYYTVRGPPSGMAGSVLHGAWPTLCLRGQGPCLRVRGLGPCLRGLGPCLHGLGPCLRGLGPYLHGLGLQGFELLGFELMGLAAQQGMRRKGLVAMRTGVPHAGTMHA